MTTEQTISQLADYGVLGIIVIVLVMYLNKTRDQHAKERDEWRQQYEKQFTLMTQQQDKHFQEMKNVAEKTAGVIADSRGLLESIDNHIRYKQ